MSWNEQRVKERVDKHTFQDFDVNVADLSTTMDFANLSTKDVRRVDGVHLYADVPNFHLAVEDAGNDKQKQRKLLRAASVLRRVQGDLLKSKDIVGDKEIGKIQLQACRLHALCYRPYNDEADRANRSVALAISLNTYIYEVFNDVFSDVRNFRSAVGMASGQSLVANIGFHGDRERICLGTPANMGAKVLGLGNTITVTAEIYDVLHEDLAEHFSEHDETCGVKTYIARGLKWSEQEELATTLGIKWDAEHWKKATESYRDALVLSDMEISWASSKIDVDSLTEKNSRRTDAIAIYADLDGFTSYVQGAEDNDAVISLVRDLHMIRHEFHAVLKSDFPGLVLQHQGDRVFAILHEPFGDNDGDHKSRCQKALDAAIGIQSSMEHVLQSKLTNRENLSVAVGLAVGTVIVTRLGKQGKREVVCIGPEVVTAERLQLDSGAKEITISGAIFDAVEREAVKKAFTKRNGNYHAIDLTFPSIEEAEAEALAKSSALVSVVRENRVHIGSGSEPQSRPWLNIS